MAAIGATTDLDDDSMPALLTIPECAALLRVDKTTAYRMAERGDLPIVRFGTTIRVVRRALLEKLGQS